MGVVSDDESPTRNFDKMDPEVLKELKRQQKESALIKQKDELNIKSLFEKNLRDDIKNLVQQKTNDQKAKKITKNKTIGDLPEPASTGSFNKKKPSVKYQKPIIDKKPKSKKKDEDSMSDYD